MLLDIIERPQPHLGAFRIAPQHDHGFLNKARAVEFPIILEVKDVRRRYMRISVVDRGDLPAALASRQPEDLSVDIALAQRFGDVWTILDDDGLVDCKTVMGKEAIQRTLQQVVPAATRYDRCDGVFGSAPSDCQLRRCIRGAGPGAKRSRSVAESQFRLSARKDVRRDQIAATGRVIIVCHRYP